MNVSHLCNTESPVSDFSIQGSGYCIQEDRVTLSIEQLLSNRSADNISGSLMLELWALPTQYLGGGFGGELLAYTSIAPLSGQCYLPNLCFNLPFTSPTPGQWYITLMVREWDGSQYITRDYVNYENPFCVEAKPVVSRSTSDNVISVDFGHVDHSANNQNRLDSLAPSQVVKDSPLKHEGDAESAPPKKAAKSGKRASKVNPSGKAIAKKVSINKASLSELEGIKGLPVKVAKLIFQTRPHKKIDELLALKGMGPKLLKKIEHLIKL